MTPELQLQSGEAIKARVPGTAIVMLPDCRHSPHRDRREATLEKMAEFVGRLTRAGIGNSSKSQQQAADSHG